MKIVILIFFIIFSFTSCNKIKVDYKLNSSNIISSNLNNYFVENSSDGTGAKVSGLTLEVGNNYNLYAISRSTSGGFLGNLAVSWAKSGTGGDLLIQGSGESSLFIPTTPGVVDVAMSVNGKQVRVVSITVIPAAHSPLSVSNLTISSITSSGFRSTINFTGGSPSQSHMLYYCNATVTPGCDPSMGLFSIMVNSGATYYADLTGLASPTNTFNVRVISTDSVTVTGSPQNTTTTLLGSGIVISGAVASNNSKRGMTVTTNFTGDSENNATLALYYCNHTDSNSCNPLMGTQLSMTRSGSTYVATIAGLSSPDDENDQLNLRVVATDPNGVTGSPVNTTSRLTDLTVSSISTTDINSTSFTTSVNFTGDANATGVVSLYYCNETDSPGCNPLLGTAVVMTRGAGVFTANVTGLVSPNDPGDQLNLQIGAVDAADGALVSGQVTQTIRLVDLELTNLTVTEISDTRFFISLLVTNRDNNANTTATFYYCDMTANAACNPAMGTSGAMGFSQWPDRYSVDYANHAIPPGHTVKMNVVVSDVDIIYGSAQVSNFIIFNTTFKIPDPTDIYRSVGPGQVTALHQGGAVGTEMAIVGSTAYFTTQLSNQVGVGDALFYDANNDGIIDNVAFIHGRTGNDTYTVKDVNGDTPIAASAHLKWKLYRAYTNVANAENGIENSGITSDGEISAGLRNFDSWVGGKDISAQTGSDENWHFALYAGVTADNMKMTMATSSWPKDRSQYVKFYTPYLASEVGVSQRHSGVWDNSKYRLVVNNNSAMEIRVTKTIVEGVQIELTGTTNDVYGIYMSNSSEGRVISNLIKSSSTGTGLDGVLFYNHSVFGDRWLWVYNNIIYNFNTTSSIGFNVDWSDAEGRGARLYNNTFYNNYIGIHLDTWAAALVNNNIILGSINSDFTSGGTAAQELRNNIVGDNTYNTIGVWGPRTGNITGLTTNTVFLDVLNEDFRMAVGSSAIGAGIDASTIFTTDITGATRSVPFDIGPFKN